MRLWKVLCCTFLVCLLTACGQTAALAPEEPAPAEETPQMSALSEENAPARAAYAAALKTLLDTNVLPDGTDCSEGYIGSVSEREAMAENQFSVYDVDGDGREELVLLYTTSAVAGERGFVFDWDAETDTLRTQLSEFPLLTFYKNGAVTAGWSHNQGKGGRFWPYFLYAYDADADSYTAVGAVDAWDEELDTENYPADVDVSGSGFVYYIYEDLTAQWDKIDPVDEQDYQAWLAPSLGDGEELTVPYDALTAENIHGLLAAG